MKPKWKIKNEKKATEVFCRVRALSAKLKQCMDEYAQSLSDTVKDFDKPVTVDFKKLSDECFCDKVKDLLTDFQQEQINMREIDDILNPPAP